MSAFVLGDTFSAGVGGVPGPQWPDLLAEELGWRTTVDAVPGSGYLAAGAGTDFVDRVEAVVDREPDVVQRLASALPDTEVVVLSPFSDGPPGELTTALTGALEEVAADGGAAFVDVSEMLPYGEDLLADDGVHPSELGHEELARRIAARLTDLGVAAD